MECMKCNSEIFRSIADARIDGKDTKFAFDAIQSILNGDRRLPAPPCINQSESCPRLLSIKTSAAVVARSCEIVSEEED